MFDEQHNPLEPISPHIAAALVAASHAISAMKADARNDHFGNEYISLSAITERAKLALKEHHVTLYHSARFGTQSSQNHAPTHQVVVTTFLVHDSGQRMSVDVALPISKQDPQGGAGAITYGRRIGISMLLGITVDEDDDGNGASGVAGTTSRITRPVTTQAQPARGSTTGPPPGKRVKMPFGRTKDQYLDELPVKELESTLAWAEDKGKFTELQEDIKRELARRAPPETSGPAVVEWDDENPAF